MLIFELNGNNETEKSLRDVISEFEDQYYADKLISRAKEYLAKHPTHYVVHFEYYGIINIYNSNPSKIQVKSKSATD